MNKVITLLAGAALLTGAALTGSAATAATAPAPAPASADPATKAGHVQLSVDHLVAGQHETSTLWLDCPGVKKPDHPHRDEACTDLDAADGDFDRLPGRPGTRCAAVQDPVSVTARGISEGRRVNWSHSYANPCEMYVATGEVFNF
ncbi:SSI family serine proteinase inhibitor [Streptomyces sp. NPDC090025]|uniref:SSI family serine proteinase inhibitor n=1 Tax=Streptomyces sp. NPDC090025 TaxID=3365922 RepID=UPI0038341C06